MDLKLVTEVDADNPCVGDIAIESGDVVLIDGIEAIGQHIQMRLQMRRGDWFLDLREGVPWIQELFQKGVPITFIRGVIRDVIESTPGVEHVLNMTTDVTNRILSVNAEVVLEDRIRLGERISNSEYINLRVELDRAGE